MTDEQTPAEAFDEIAARVHTRLAETVAVWGQVIVVEGRITINDYRAAIAGLAVPILRPDPMKEEARLAWRYVTGCAPVDDTGRRTTSLRAGPIPPSRPSS